MRFLLYLMLVVTVGAAAQAVIASQAYAPGQPTSVSVAITPLLAGSFSVAAPGRVEPASEAITIGVSVTGLLRELAVKEGDTVKRGDVLATIENDDLKAALARAEAEQRLREAELTRLNNGARPQERRQAQAAVQEAEAVARNAADYLERRRALAATGYVAQEVLDQAQRESIVARQRLEMARQKLKLIEDRARDEDIAIAEAQVAIARAKCQEAQAQLDRTTIRSPIDGTVLRVIRRAGELVTTFLDTPIMTIGDLSRVNVRADVDEADVGRVSLGMPAYVTADAFGERRFTGRVVRIGRMVGNKTIYTEEPKEHLDAKVLEVLVALDDAKVLPPGLRVNVFMAAPAMAEAAAAPQASAGE